MLCCQRGLKGRGVDVSRVNNRELLHDYSDETGDDVHLCTVVGWENR